MSNRSTTVDYSNGNGTSAGGEHTSTRDLTESLLTCISRAQQDFILDGDVRELFARLLDDVLTLTGSEYGFIGEVEEDDGSAPVLRTWAITNIAWTDELAAWYEENSPTGLVFTNLDTLFGEVIRTGSPVMANTPSSDPRRGGLPDGHPSLDAFLGLPFLLGDRMIGMVGLANRSGGYDEQLIAELQPFLTTCSTIIGALQSRREHDASKARLRVSEGRTVAILQSVVDAVIVIDEQGVVETFNQAAERTFGYDAEEILGHNIALLMSSEDASSHHGYLERYARTEEKRIIGSRREVTGRRKNGSTFPLELSISEVVIEGRRLFAGTCRDLTEKLQAESDIRMYAATIEATPDFVGVARVDGEILAINRAGRQQIGLAPDASLGGLAIGDIHAPWSRDLVREVGLPAAIRDGAWVGETGFLSPQGDEIPMSQVIVVSKDAYGEAQLVSTIARDISEHKEIERVKGEFVSTVSHELRTPLTSIRGTLGLLANGALGELPDQARQMVDLGLSNTERLIRLVNDILDFEKVRAGRLDLRLTAVDPLELAVSARSVVEGAGIEAGITIELEGPEAALDPIRGQSDRLVQVLVNLLGNAVKFSPSGGKVRMVIRQDADVTRFEVIDRGPGIAADQLETIFEPFHQLDSSDTRTVGGTGLGLAIASSLALAHGGRIEVETAVGVGSSFVLVIPSAPARDGGAGQPDSEAMPASSDSRPDVLCADSDLSSRLVINGLLAERGITCVGVIGGRDAIRQVHHRQPRLLMVDVALADLDGYEVIEQLRNQGYGDLPLIVYTDRDLRPEERDRLRLGDTRHLVKGRVDEGVMIDEIVAMLDRTRIEEVG